MSKNQSTYTSSVGSGTENKSSKSRAEIKESSRKARGDCEISNSTSHTQFFRNSRYEEGYERITSDEYFGLSESMSGSSKTFQCVHGAQGKVYTEKGLLKRNLQKGLDRVPAEPRWTQRCQAAYGRNMAAKLEFLVMDPIVGQQKDRLMVHLKDFVRISSSGYAISNLNSICTVLDYLIETLPKNPDQRDITLQLLQNIGKPIVMNDAADIMKFFDSVSNYMGFLGYLLMRLEDDDMFDIVSQAVLWHLSAPDAQRANGTTLRHTLIAAAPVMYQTVSRMTAVASSHRFPTYLNIALLLAFNSADNCMNLMKENIIENIFYRFNPYFPDRKLPYHDINPADPQDINVKLGDSSRNMSMTLSLLLILLKTMKNYLVTNPKYSLLLPCPDSYAQRCFIWAYRYECRASEHRHQRNTLTVIAMVLLHVFGERLSNFSSILMPDILTLSVMTEIPPALHDWTSTVNFNTAQQDVQFKKILIYFTIDLLKVFPSNKLMLETKHWLIGLMYLLDPGLCYLRARWSASLFAELRKTALQAMICAIPRSSPKIIKEYGLVRRILWYIEWYSENPYELPVLYWCLRLLQITIHHRGEPTRVTSLKDLFDTHGVIILIHLCYTLLEQKLPPVEKSQAILGLCLRILTSSIEPKKRVTCCVYPQYKWPCAVNALASKMLNVALYSLENNFIISDRWLISLLNFIWETIIWKKDNREMFIAKEGIYKLLDIITMARAPVQCIALALVCDATRAGEAVGQLVSWRAKLCASNAYPNVVKRGATIATLLASIFRDECQKTGVRLDHNGVIEELESPIMSTDVRKEMNSPDFSEGKSQTTANSLPVADLAGSRMSKAFAILNMLTEDLDYKVSVADETYNLYKNIQLEPEDEAVLVLCAHYLTLKLNEVWVETKVQSPGLLPHDENILDEFLNIGRGWSKEIKRQQNYVIEMDRKKKTEEENSLYEFLGRVRLNIALDALRDVRCVARTADRNLLTHALLLDAVQAHQRRSHHAKGIRAPVFRTFGPALDDKNITGQNVKVHSIYPKDKPKSIVDYPPSSEDTFSEQSLQSQ